MSIARAQDDTGSEAAFTALVERHGPMVLGVCRRVLGDEHIAADAFQAVFLVLARKARSVRVDDSLGRWLHGVSIRVARRMRSVFFAERVRAKSLAAFDRADPAQPGDRCELAELRSAIDYEIARLPGRYRRAVVYCYLEGLTQEQAAKRLRCPIGTVESRLHRARQRLRSSLLRRGLAPACGILTWMSDATAAASVPRRLAAQTTTAAVELSITGTGASALSAAGSSLLRLIGRGHDDVERVADRNAGAGGWRVGGRSGRSGWGRRRQDQKAGGSGPARAAQAERRKRADPGRSVCQDQSRVRRQAGCRFSGARNNQVSG